MNARRELASRRGAKGEGNLIALAATAIILLTEDSLLLLVAFTHNNVLNDT
jgi:hypothetical protein